MPEAVGNYGGGIELERPALLSASRIRTFSSRQLCHPMNGTLPSIAVRKGIVMFGFWK